MKQYEEMLEKIKEQESVLQFSEFTNETALTIGLYLVEQAKKENQKITQWL